MPTFRTDDPRFDDIEYWIVEKPWGPRTAGYIVYLNCDGSQHTSSRVYRDAADAEAHVDEDLGFQVKYWTEQLDDREHAAVVDGVHYRMGTRTCAPQHRGFGGSPFIFKPLVGEGEIVCSDTWYQGIIPVWARKAFPNTHTLG
jgi:hypothetical protein